MTLTLHLIPPCLAFEAGRPAPSHLDPDPCRRWRLPPSNLSLMLLASQAGLVLAFVGALAGRGTLARPAGLVETAAALHPGRSGGNTTHSLVASSNDIWTTTLLAEDRVPEVARVALFSRSVGCLSIPGYLQKLISVCISRIAYCKPMTSWSCGGALSFSARRLISRHSPLARVSSSSGPCDALPGVNLIASGGDSGTTGEPSWYVAHDPASGQPSPSLLPSMLSR